MPIMNLRNGQYHVPSVTSTEGSDVTHYKLPTDAGSSSEGSDVTRYKLPTEVGSSNGRSVTVSQEGSDVTRYKLPSNAPAKSLSQRKSESVISSSSSRVSVPLAETTLKKLTKAELVGMAAKKLKGFTAESLQTHTRAQIIDMLLADSAASHASKTKNSPTGDVSSVIGKDLIMDKFLQGKKAKKRKADDDADSGMGSSTSSKHKKSDDVKPEASTSSKKAEDKVQLPKPEEAIKELEKVAPSKIMSVVKFIAKLPFTTIMKLVTGSKTAFNELRKQFPDVHPATLPVLVFAAITGGFWTGPAAALGFIGSATFGIFSWLNPVKDQAQAIVQDVIKAESDSDVSDSEDSDLEA